MQTSQRSLIYIYAVCVWCAVVHIVFSILIFHLQFSFSFFHLRQSATLSLWWWRRGLRVSRRRPQTSTARFSWLFLIPSFHVIRIDIRDRSVQTVSTMLIYNICLFLLPPPPDRCYYHHYVTIGDERVQHLPQNAQLTSYPTHTVCGQT